MALLSNHTPPLLALIICLTVDVGMFLALLLTTRLAFFLLIFLGEVGTPMVAMVLKASRSFLGALRCLLLPRTRIFERREVGPATTPAVLKVRRRHF